MFVRKSKSGFTLVEILIVVIILGILAAIVIPQFTNASQDARRSSLVSQLQTLRSQIQLYRLQHGEVLPNLIGGTDGANPDTSNWDAFTGTSTYGGRTFGPYMQAPPKNPLNNLGAVTEGNDPTAAATAACGFVYDYATTATGRIWGTDTDGVTIFVE